MVQSLRTFVWWFVIGATMALAVVLLQGGIRDILQMDGPLWEGKVIEILTAVTGGGLLGGCIALILNRIKKA
ncbi:hypothetical protein YTPLAS18_19680 [Nitrospira sp.]|nr:hypothetical protein YTPLAS18_19680 [Nitrospira sp.]